MPPLRLWAITELRVLGSGALRRSMHELVEASGGCEPSEGTTGALVELAGDVIEPLPVDPGEVDGAGEVLAQQPIGVLVGAPLPGAAGVTEVHGDAAGGGEALVRGHFAALVPGERAAQMGGEGAEVAEQLGVEAF